ncbi:MAG: ATP-binding cassette domain-containing protein [Planctomycetes bacterium]|nr:ATP-binding cassette domain-containing protein [Planctomycetota bacterium]
MESALPDPAVAARALVVRYGDRAVLDGVDVEVPRGAITVVLGGSGCGKSTLLRALTGLARPAGGEVRVLGVDLATADEDAVDSVRRRIGVAFQAGALLGSLTVAENVALPLREAGVDEEAIGVIVRMKLALVGLAEAAGRRPAELSGGMVKRAGLARALALDPELVFCDEPSAGLDPVTAAGLDALLIRIQRSLGATLVVVTHELASIHAIADRAVMLHGGRILAQGTLAEVREAPDPRVRAFFDRVAQGA